MPNRLTTAGQRWIQIAQRHPSLDSTPILKLCQFAAKLDTDERKLRRLTRLADNQPSEPENPRIVEARSALTRTAAAKQRHQERLDWWVNRAVKQGWPLSDTADAAQISIDQASGAAAEALAERQQREAAQCDFCGKPWAQPSAYCRHGDAHTEPACER